MSQQEFFLALVGAFVVCSVLRYAANLAIGGFAMWSLRRARATLSPEHMARIEADARAASGVDEDLEQLVNEHDRRLCSIETAAGVVWSDSAQCHVPKSPTPTDAKM